MQEKNVKIVAIPFPMPSIALSVSGLPTHNFLFLGFLKGKLAFQNLLSKWIEFEDLIFNQNIRLNLPLNRLRYSVNRYISVSRLTKVHENLKSELFCKLEKILSSSQKGELLLLLPHQGSHYEEK